MKKIFVGAILLVCLLHSPILYAATTFLQYEIIGLTQPLLESIKKPLEDEIPDKKILTDEEVAEWYQQSVITIRNTLASHGYFKPKIQAKLKRQRTGWIATYYIVPGQVIRIIQININITGAGKDNPILKQALNKLPLQIGKPLETISYNQTKQQLFNAALAQGYLDAQLDKHIIVINRHRYTAIVTLLLNTGPRYYFGPVTFNQEFFNNALLYGYMRFKSGEPYSSKRLLASQEALSNSNYFQQVQAKTLPNPNTQQVPVEFKLVPRPSQQYTVGIGYGTDTGGRGLLGWDWRHITRNGHRMSAYIQASQVQNTVQAVYRIPGANPRISEYQISIGATKNNLPTVDSFTKQIGIASVTNKKHWQQSLFLNYSIEDFKFDNESSSHRTHILTPGITFTKIHADNMVYSQNGYRISLRLQGSLEHVLAATNFFQAEAQAKYIRSFGSNNDHRIIVRGDIGYTAVNDLPNFPATLRFYAGGTQSVRAYNYQELGPGRHLVVGSFEYQHRVVGNWHAAVFYDAGNAFNNFPASLNRGVGVGIVWASPLGPMELTVGKALNDPRKTIRIQFNMGPDFA